MAYDEVLADRARTALRDEPGLGERKMFGGLAFSIRGNMAIAVSGQGGVIVRVDPGDAANLIQTSNARWMEMRGRQLRGWLRVGEADLHTVEELARWVDLGAAYARSLPPKQ